MVRKTKGRRAAEHRGGMRATEEEPRANDGDVERETDECV